MAGSILPVAVAHGEGRAEFAEADGAGRCLAAGLVAVRYINNDGSPAATYPANPSGTPLGMAALTSADGRVTITMPHPERSFRYLQNFLAPAGCGGLQRLDAPVPQRQAFRRLGRAPQLVGTNGARCEPVSSRKKRRTMMACCSLPLRT